MTDSCILTHCYTLFKSFVDIVSFKTQTGLVNGVCITFNWIYSNRSNISNDQESVVRVKKYTELNQKSEPESPREEKTIYGYFIGGCGGGQKPG